MLNRLSFPLVLALGVFATASHEASRPEDPITSRLVVPTDGERILIQEVWLAAPVESVWKAYTTDAGWTAWASPKARIDLRLGGKILTHYVQGAEIGDPGTNTLTIVSYVPNELLTLKADLEPNWPEVMKRDAGRLSNTIHFESVGPELTRVRSYGVGYGTGEEYDGLLEFFVAANEGLFEHLVRFVETGQRREY